MNIKLRLQNKVTLVALIASTVSLVYMVLTLFGITPSVTQSQIGDIAATLIDVLLILGVVVDPTTKGIGDSKRAQGYDRPAPLDSDIA